MQLTNGDHIFWAGLSPYLLIVKSSNTCWIRGFPHHLNTSIWQSFLALITRLSTELDTSILCQMFFPAAMRCVQFKQFQPLYFIVSTNWTKPVFVILKLALSSQPSNKAYPQGKGSLLCTTDCITRIKSLYHKARIGVLRSSTNFTNHCKPGIQVNSAPTVDFLATLLGLVCAKRSRCLWLLAPNANATLMKLSIHLACRIPYLF